jgi:two-component system chemotaxis sensor kinase CheA
MNPSDEEFLRTLRATFAIEAAEHLQTISTGLLELEKTSSPTDQLPIVETVYRAAHSLKGAARAVDFAEVEAVCQSLEDLFAAWKRQESQPSAAALDKAHLAVDQMSRVIAPPAEPPPRIATPRPAPIQAARKPELPVAATHPPTPGPEHETVRVAASSLDARVLEAEEMLAAKLAAGQRAADLGVLAGHLEHWRKEWAKTQSHVHAVRRTVERDAGHANTAALVSFLEWTHDHLRALDAKVSALRRAAEQDHLAVGRLVDDLLENSKKLLMLPLATVGTLFPKLVRDLCRDQGKQADLILRGEEVKIDKRILEELKDPIVHLLRNCIDHGIERPEDRQRAGKPPRATLALTISQVDGNQVEIEIRDDGAGIDIEKVKSAAVRRGIVTAEAADRLTDAAARALVFEADVSTSPMITELSGRGLGLAIVREKTEKLGGRVAIESERNVGTTIRMRVPTTLATFRGVLIQAAQRLFIVPTSQVERATRFSRDDVRTVKGRETIALNERAVALVDLAKVLELPAVRARNGSTTSKRPALILGSGEQRLAFAVDAVLGEREVLVKRFAKPLSRIRNVAGATVLASGEVTPILNVMDLLKSARQHGASEAQQAPQPQVVASTSKRILVAEDSITSRMLLKGILESAGYDVKTVVDGVEAYTALRSEHFDVIVSDVEMPRMNGFDLTARIRADRALAELPVVLVTALASREDRERGIDVGANAYLIKSDLDQSNLLGALRRLA